MEVAGVAGHSAKAPVATLLESGRMALAKKLRQRRRRLVQKRRLRKKGRWPPSKMKKLKNV